MENKYIVLDTETTGLNAAEDEILQVSIIDNEGAVLFDSYIKPTQHTEWAEAERIHHITPEMVADAPTIAEVMSIPAHCSPSRRSARRWITSAESANTEERSALKSSLTA